MDNVKYQGNSNTKMNNSPIPLRRRVLSLAASALILIIFAWTLWGPYMAMKWLIWYNSNEHPLVNWLIVVVCVAYLANMAFCMWFFRWLGIVVRNHILNR